MSLQSSFDPIDIAVHFKLIADNMNALSKKGFTFGDQKNHNTIQQFAENVYTIMANYAFERNLDEAIANQETEKQLINKMLEEALK